MSKKELTKRKRSYTLTDEVDEYMQLIADKLGISKTAVIEISVRRMAEVEGFVSTERPAK